MLLEISGKIQNLKQNKTQSANTVPRMHLGCIFSLLFLCHLNPHGQPHSAHTAPRMHLGCTFSVLSLESALSISDVITRKKIIIQKQVEQKDLTECKFSVFFSFWSIFPGIIVGSCSNIV